VPCHAACSLITERRYSTNYTHDEFVHKAPYWVFENLFATTRLYDRVTILGSSTARQAHRTDADCVCGLFCGTARGRKWGGETHSSTGTQHGCIMLLRPTSECLYVGRRRTTIRFIDVEGLVVPFANGLRILYQQEDINK
jgi:hypothetical protein